MNIAKVPYAQWVILLPTKKPVTTCAITWAFLSHHRAPPLINRQTTANPAKMKVGAITTPTTYQLITCSSINVA